MAFSHYEPNHADVAKLMRTSEMERVVATVADDALRFAESISPVVTGDYRSKFRVEAATETISGDLRAVVRVVNDSDHALAVEGTHSVLRRTADHVEGT
jgi:ketosteroid isomerase-like protein